MDKLTKSILLAGVVFSLQLMDCYKGSLVLGQNVVQRTEVVRTQVSTDSAQIMQVTLKSLSASADKSALESIQNILQNIEGVIYVGVNYDSGEVTVRYLTPKVGLQTLMSTLEKTENKVALVSGPAIVKSGTVDGAPIDVHGFVPEIQLQCLRQKEANALCEKHFNGLLPDGIDLENCYTVKVDFRTSAHVDGNYDWLSQTCLVDEKGTLVKPLAWLEFPLRETPKKGTLSGLLIFPKIPPLKIGLTLRLLRANGDGYDSYTIDLPNLTR